MSVRRLLLGLVLIPGLCAAGSPADAQTANLQQTLDQYVADLQSNPNDTALRENIIALAQTMNPPPDVPAEARRHMARGVAAVEDAKTPADFKDACNEFQQAATLAPWLANAYRNLAIAQDKAGMYDQALASLRLYLLTKPSSADVDWADDLKAKVEYRKEKAAKAKEESAPQPIAVPKENSFEELLGKIDGRRYTYQYMNGNTPQTSVIDVRGRAFVCGTIQDGEYHYRINIPIESRVTNQHMQYAVQGWATYSISDDGGSITTRGQGGYPGATYNESVHTWQR